MAGRRGSKYSPEEFKAIIKARNAAYRQSHQAEIREKRLAAYEERRSGDVSKAKKRGRPLKYRTVEQVREADRAKAARYFENNRAKVLARNRPKLKERKRLRAIAEGRVPGRVGNPKRFETEQERLLAKRAKTARYRDKDPERTLLQYKIAQHRRRARKLKAGGSYTAEDIADLLRMQKGNCSFCLQPLGSDFHVDHYQPLTRGGSNDRKNLRLLHQRCNLRKHGSDPIEHALKNGMLCW